MDLVLLFAGLIMSVYGVRFESGRNKFKSVQSSRTGQGLGPLKRGQGLREDLGFATDYGLQELTSITNTNNIKAYKYRQTYCGLPVYAGRMVFVADTQDNIQRARGKLLKDIDADLADCTIVADRIQPDEAELIAKNYLISKYPSLSATGAYFKYDTKLFVSRDIKRAGQPTRTAILMYYVRAYALPFSTQEPFAVAFKINAKTREILEDWDNKMRRRRKNNRRLRSTKNERKMILLKALKKFIMDKILQKENEVNNLPAKVSDTQILQNPQEVSYMQPIVEPSIELSRTGMQPFNVERDKMHALSRHYETSQSFQKSGYTQMHPDEVGSNSKQSKKHSYFTKKDVNVLLQIINHYRALKHLNKPQVKNKHSLPRKVSNVMISSVRPEKTKINTFNYQPNLVNHELKTVSVDKNSFIDSSHSQPVSDLHTGHDSDVNKNSDLQNLNKILRYHLEKFRQQQQNVPYLDNERLQKTSNIPGENKDFYIQQKMQYNLAMHNHDASHSSNDFGTTNSGPFQRMGSRIGQNRFRYRYGFSDSLPQPMPLFNSPNRMRSSKILALEQILRARSNTNRGYYYNLNVPYIYPGIFLTLPNSGRAYYPNTHYSTSSVAVSNIPKMQVNKISISKVSIPANKEELINETTIKKGNSGNVMNMTTTKMSNTIVTEIAIPSEVPPILKETIIILNKPNSSLTTSVSNKIKIPLPIKSKQREFPGEDELPRPTHRPDKLQDSKSKNVEIVDKPKDLPKNIIDSDDDSDIVTLLSKLFVDFPSVGGNEKFVFKYGGKNGDVFLPPLFVKANGSNCFLSRPEYEVYHAKNAETMGSFKGIRAFKFPCASTELGDKTANGGNSPLSDLHFYTNKTFDMFREYVNFPPWEGPEKLRVYGHVNDSMVNAYYSSGAVYFGDGDEIFFPLTSADIIAHEICHGFTEQSSDLEYRSIGGGMSEAISDLCGAALKHYLFGDISFLVGSHVYRIDVPSPYLRNMCNQSEDQHSASHVKDYNPKMDVHEIGGIFNNFICHLTSQPSYDIVSTFKLIMNANKVGFGEEPDDFEEIACELKYSAEFMDYNVVELEESMLHAGLECKDK